MKCFILLLFIFMSSIVYSQTIGGIAISSSGIEFCIGQKQDNLLYISSDVKFPHMFNSSGYINSGLGYNINNNIFSFKCGIYSPNKYNALKLQYGFEYLRKLKHIYLGISYLNESKLSIKILINIE